MPVLDTHLLTNSGKSYLQSSALSLHGSLRSMGLTFHSFLHWCVPPSPLMSSQQSSQGLTSGFAQKFCLWTEKFSQSISCGASSSLLHHAPLPTLAGSYVCFWGKYLSPSDLQWDKKNSFPSHQTCASSILLEGWDIAACLEERYLLFL